jgi:hypothetical protein
MERPGAHSTQPQPDAWSLTYVCPGLFLAMAHGLVHGTHGTWNMELLVIDLDTQPQYKDTALPPALEAVC